MSPKVDKGRDTLPTARKGLALPPHPPAPPTTSASTSPSLFLNSSKPFSAITVSPVLDARPVRGRHNLDNLIAESAVDAFIGTEEWDDTHGREVW